MKRHLGSERISPPAGFEPKTRDRKSRALTARPRGRFSHEMEDIGVPDIVLTLFTFISIAQKAHRIYKRVLEGVDVGVLWFYME